ncbi:MAG: phosphate propanoyltransferase [Filifactoraceae bacterium]
MTEQYDAIIQLLVEAVQDELKKTKITQNQEIPVGISNRHLHLSQKDKDILFGEGYNFTNIKDLSQPGQFACKETVTIAGPKSAIEKVRIIGPERKATQVELLKADSIKLGISYNLRLSGDIYNTSGLTIIGPKGSVQINEGAIVAQRHIHMTPVDAKNFNVNDGEIVDIKVEGERGGIFSNVIIRATEMSQLECHIDTEEANAMDLNSSSKVSIIKKF